MKGICLPFGTSQLRGELQTGGLGRAAQVVRVNAATISSAPLRSFTTEKRYDGLDCVPKNHIHFLKFESDFRGDL